MKPETVLLLRKLAREATIFALLGMVVATVGIFVKLDMDERAEAKLAARRAVHALLTNPHFELQISVSYSSKTVPIAHAPQDQSERTVSVPLTNGTVLFIHSCGVHLVSPKDCRNFSETNKEQFRRANLNVPLGDEDQIAIERDYWAAYKAKRESVGTVLLGSLLFGLWGFPAGLALWIFHRLVRFAVKG